MFFKKKKSDPGQKHQRKSKIILILFFKEKFPRRKECHKFIMSKNIWSEFKIFTEIPCPQYNLSGLKVGVSLLKISVSNWSVPQRAPDPWLESSFYEHKLVDTCVSVCCVEIFNRNILRQTIGQQKKNKIKNYIQIHEL